MERLYQFLWKSGVAGKNFRLVDGPEISILFPGVLNNDAGPDFFNARFMIGGTLMAGNVEIHVKASDWHRHGHDTDRAYDSVALHVVAVNDTRIRRHDGTVIPQLEIVLPRSFYPLFATLNADWKGVKCQNMIAALPPLAVTDWLESLAVERIQAKAARVATYYHQSNSDWDQACFITLARSLGFGLNGDPFEMTARSLPLRYVYHHSDSLPQIEALLFGQAALLDPSTEIPDEYHRLLCREYFFLAKKYGLRPIPPAQWKFARTRPQNFPHRRMAYLAKMLSSGIFSVKSLVDRCNDIEGLRQLFRITLDGYWKGRYTFGSEERTAAPATMSKNSVDLLLINTAAPIIYTYGSMRGEPGIAESALNILEEIPPESNSIIRMWAHTGIKCDSAFTSQALIHLRRNYCDSNNCLSCRFGHLLLRREANRRQFSRRLFHPASMPAKEMWPLP